MQLYEIFTLKDTNSESNPGYYGYLKAPDITNVKWKEFSKDTTIGFYLDRFIPEKFEFTVVPSSSYDKATVILNLHMKNKDKSKKESSPVLKIATICISSVNFNCGAVHLSNLNSYFTRKGFGDYLLNEVIDWCKKVGYTIVFGNTAGDQNRYALPFFEKRGFKRMAEPYKNIRSGNTNIWIHKLIKEEATEISEDDEDFEDED